MRRPRPRITVRFYEKVQAKKQTVSFYKKAKAKKQTVCKEMGGQETNCKFLRDGQGQTWSFYEKAKAKLEVFTRRPRPNLKFLREGQGTNCNVGFDEIQKIEVRYSSAKVD